MADATIPVQNPGTTDSNLDAESLTVSSVTVKRERMQIAGAAATEIARVLATIPATSDMGVVARLVGILADNAAFTDGTSPVLPAGYIFDEVAGTALTENDVAAARVDSKRAQVMVIEDATTRGRRVLVQTSGAMLVDNEELPAAAALGDSVANPTTTVVGAVPLLWNGTTLEREQGNADGTLLSSAARTTTTNAPDQTNRNHRGVLLMLNVTANPGAAETLSVKLQVKDSISASYIDVADFGVAFTAANGAKAFLAYPGAVAADFLAAGGVAKGVALARVWRAVITHSASGSWTYSLSAALLV